MSQPSIVSVAELASRLDAQAMPPSNLALGVENESASKLAALPPAVIGLLMQTAPPAPKYFVDNVPLDRTGEPSTPEPAQPAWFARCWRGSGNEADRKRWETLQRWREGGLKLELISDMEVRMYACALAAVKNARERESWAKVAAQSSAEAAWRWYWVARLVNHAPAEVLAAWAQGSATP